MAEIRLCVKELQQQGKHAEFRIKSIVCSIRERYRQMKRQTDNQKQKK